MALDIDTVYRDNIVKGDIHSGEHYPDKAEIRALLKTISGAASAPAVVKQTKAALDAVTPASETYGGLVLNDPDPTKNGYYYRSSSTWVKGRGLPDSIAEVTLAGTANAQTGTASGVNPADVVTFFAVVSTENTGPMTLSISAETPREVVNSAGNPLSAGEWTGAVLFFLNGDGDYQLLINPGAEAAAAQSATDAAAARDETLLRFLGAYANDGAATTAAGTPSEGQLYWNSTDDILKSWNGSGWVSATQAAGTVTISTATGDGGDDYTLDAGAQATNTILAIGGLTQSSGFTLVDGALSVTGGVPSGVSIWAISFETVPLGTTTADLVSMSGGGTLQQKYDSTGAAYIKGKYRVSSHGGSIATAMAAAEADGGGTVEVDTHGTIVASEALLIPSTVDLVGLGDTVVDVSGMATGDLDGLYAVKKDGGGLTSLGSFTSIAALDEHITFSTTPDVEIGQIICIYDSANGSFLPLTDGFAGRDYYRRGQRSRVVGISGNTIYLDQAIRVAYSSGGTTTIYKQSSTSGRLGGIRFDATGYATAGNRVFRARYGDRLRIEDCDFIGGAYASCEIDQCYETEINWGTFETDIATASANSYPLSILNSAHTRARDFKARGKWNGVGTGGDDIIGAIQSYDTLFEGFYASGIDAPGVDIHGNSELTRMVRGVIDNGISFGGKDTYYRDCHVTDKDYLYAALWAEVWGGDHHFDGGSIAINNASASGRFNIDAFGGAAFRAVQDATNIKIHTRITAPLAERLMGLRLDAAVQRVNFDVDLKLHDVGSLTTCVELYRDVASSDGAYARWRFSGVPGGIADPITLSGSNVYSATATVERGVTVS